MTSVEIYIKIGTEFKRIDLFKDEKISLTSNVQNINDLSKVFTDYTQSFTIPASKNNNIIFNYWNENGVNDGFDHRIRYDSIIELNTIPFKTGKIQIEKANEKSNKIESYSITFYGDVKQIKDLFKEDKLGVLDYSSLNHNSGLTNIKNRINGTIDDGNIYYPIVGNKHRYLYNSSTLYDVTIGDIPDNSIVYSDLFPAIPVSKIFDFIEAKYNINFTSTLFSTSYWTELFLYCKNTEQKDNYSFTTRVNFDATTCPRTTNLTTNTYTIDWLLNDNVTPVNSQSSNLIINPSDSTILYRVKIYNSNGLINVVSNLMGASVVPLFNFFQDNSVNYEMWFILESTGSFSYTSSLLETKYSGSWMVGISQQENNSTGSNSASTQIAQMGSFIPDMKVIDFFNGIIKIFNLTITATNSNTFNIEPLEFFYSYGKYIDINSYVIADSTEIDRPKLFKKLSFVHEKSENVLNNYFRNAFSRGYDYGDLLYENNESNESSTYEIKSPFENVMWEKTIAEDFQTTSLIDKDLKPYKPKPILMYKNNLQYLDNSIKISDGTTYLASNYYRRFSNELELNGDISTINFGSEVSSWNSLYYTNNSLFNLWYKDYISALYNIRCRIVKLKAIFPIPKLVDIKLNDKLIYKDKKYIINQFTTDLTTGEVDLELITDFREVTLSEGGNGRFALKQTFNIDNTTQDLEVTILKLNSDSYDVNYYPTSYQSLGNIQDDTFIVPIDANTTGDVAFKQIELTYYNPDVKQYINIIQNA